MVGEPESRSEAIRRKNGIPIQRSVVESLLEEAEALDVSFPVGIPASSPQSPYNVEKHKHKHGPLCGPHCTD